MKKQQLILFALLAAAGIGYWWYQKDKTTPAKTVSVGSGGATNPNYNPVNPDVSQTDTDKKIADLARVVAKTPVPDVSIGATNWLKKYDLVTTPAPAITRPKAQFHPIR